MPIFVAPRKSGAHRIAAIALYRALLTTCKTTTTIPTEQRPALRNVIRNRFKHNANLTSKHLLKDAFVAGHEALDTLHSSAFNPSIQTLLTKLPASLTTPPSPPPKPSTPNPAPLNSGWKHSTLASRPRPHTALGGTSIRKIPVLVSANKIPLLRYKKPQPQALSLYFKAKMTQRQKRHDRRWELLEQSALARWEDVWDREVEMRMRKQKQKQGGGGGGGVAMTSSAKEMEAETAAAEEKPWDWEIVACLHEISRQLDRESEKNRIWASRMVRIIDEEKKLAEAERKERVMAKNSRHRERKRIREEMGGE